MLISFLYAVNYFNDEGAIESGFFAFRSDSDMAEHFDGAIESVKYMGPISIEGFFDDEEDDDDDEKP
jgi:hypothetical protein